MQSAMRQGRPAEKPRIALLQQGLSGQTQIVP